jgi:hypothetical protein
VLPCILFSLFAARFLIEDLASPEERGLIILAKAVLVFVTTLVLTSEAANCLSQPTLPPTQPRTSNVLHKKREVSPATGERVRPWRENSAPNLRWSSDSSDEVKEVVKQLRKKKKISKEKRESLDEESLRKRLSEMFKPKRHEMLGVRRETVEEVDPLV